MSCTTNYESNKRPTSVVASNNGFAVPWRRPNVRHTSNELYVDMVETLHVTLAPTGRPIAAFCHGSILLNAKVSGMPSILLTLHSRNGSLSDLVELPVFHPCVRVAQWKRNPGTLSFVPPDGKCVLAAYEVDLLPAEMSLDDWLGVDLHLPVGMTIETGQGPFGTGFEVKLSFQADENAVMENLVVVIPLKYEVSRVTEMKASRGEVSYNSYDCLIDWRLSAKEIGEGRSATLRAAVGTAAPMSVEPSEEEKAKNALLMPSSASISFSVRDWLASGLCVDKLEVDLGNSRGLAQGVKPFKGVKYMTLSRQGIEMRVGGSVHRAG